MQVSLADAPILKTRFHRGTGHDGKRCDRCRERDDASSRKPPVERRGTQNEGFGRTVARESHQPSDACRDRLSEHHVTHHHRNRRLSQNTATMRSGCVAFERTLARRMRMLNRSHTHVSSSTSARRSSVTSFCSGSANPLTNLTPSDCNTSVGSRRSLGSLQANRSATRPSLVRTR
jgi:hypothetical protein